MTTPTNPIKTRSLQKLFIALVGAALMGLTSSCSTMAGFGNDVENTGEAIEDAAY